MVHAKERKNTAEATAKIRVIKKADVGELVPVSNRPKKEVARRMVETVMNWVSDFQTRKIEETRLAMERFQHM